MDARRREDKLFIKIEGRLACGVDACDACPAEHPWDVVGDGIADGRVGGSRDVADGENVPQGDVALEDKLCLLLWRQGLWRIEKFRHERPETVPRVAIVEAGLPAFHGWEAAENKDMAVGKI